MELCTDPLTSYVHAVTTALELEEDEERKDKAFIDKSDIHNLECMGLALTKMSVLTFCHAPSGLVTVTFAHSFEKVLKSHIIGEGDTVTIKVPDKTGTRGLSSQYPYAVGVVDSVTSKNISIELECVEPFYNVAKNYFAIIKSEHFATYDRMKRAVKRLSTNPLKTEYLTNLLFAKAPLLQIPIPPSLLAGKKLRFLNQDLHPTQQAAISFALQQKHLAVIHGPPGTGKTTTLVELICQLTKSGEKVLVCAPSNVAVDNILAKAALYIPNVVRLGHVARIAEDNKQYSMQSRMAKSSSASALLSAKVELQKEIEKLSKSPHKNYTAIKRLKAEIVKRQRKLARESGLGVSCCFVTLGSVYRENLAQYFSDEFFTTLIIDECTQGLEPACWMAVPHAKRCIVAGDDCQLPPVILSREAKQLGLDQTLMQRAVTHLGTAVYHLLTHQYRMHTSIMSWVSRQMYGGNLTADTTVANHLLCDLPGVEDNDITGTPLLLIDTAGCKMHEYTIKNDQPVPKARGYPGSYCNDGEAQLVLGVVKDLVAAGVCPESIGIISPYNKQVDLIKEYLTTAFLNIEVSTVDGFQGREKEAVLVSLVRSNAEHSIGFLSDKRRLNVAVSRARRLLCVIGDTSTFEEDSTICQLVKHVREFGLYWRAKGLGYEITVNQTPSEIPTARSRKVAKNTTANDAETVEAGPTYANLASVIKKLQQFDVSDEKSLVLHCSLVNYAKLRILGLVEFHGFQHSVLGKPEAGCILVEKMDPNTDSQKDIKIRMKKYYAEIDQCVASGVTVKFPSHLSIIQRKYIHEEAERRGLDHVSFGEGFDRYITVSKRSVSPAKDANTQLVKKEDNINTVSGKACQQAPKSETVVQNPKYKTNTKEPKCGKVAESKSDKTVITEDVIVNLTKDVKNWVVDQASGEKPLINSVCDTLNKPNQKIPSLQEPLMPKLKLHKSEKKVVQSKVESEEVRECEDNKVLRKFASEGVRCCAPRCKQSVVMIGHNCPFCKRRYCIPHTLPEVHGCELDAKKAARKEFTHPPPKPLSTDEKKKLRKTLESKLSAKSLLRKGGGGNNK